MFGLKELPRYLRPHVPPIGSKQVARPGNGSEPSGNLDLESIGVVCITLNSAPSRVAARTYHC
jgi:hypothetical protein